MKKVVFVSFLITLCTLSVTFKPAAGADGKAEWEKVVAAAKKEGKVVVCSGPGANFRNAALPFQKAYPDIKVEFSGMSGRDFAPKILAERKAGLHLWDVHQGGTVTPLDILKPHGALDPLRPVLMLPEVLDSSTWVGGLEDSWIDSAGQYIFQAEGVLTFIAFVNRNVVPESELNVVDQLVEPKWKGKIVAEDPRTAGKTGVSIAHLLMVKGEEWTRKLLAQNLVIMDNNRQRAEVVIRGRFPLGMGLSTTNLLEFEQAGLIDHVKALAPDTSAGSKPSSGFGNVMLINRAPHPNAAKVFINWFLSREGQKAWVEATTNNSRRLDVEGPAETALKPNAKYHNVNLEKNAHYIERALKIAKELIK